MCPILGVHSITIAYNIVRKPKSAGRYGLSEIRNPEELERISLAFTK